jgi:uncharacterized protein (DUF1501 family)
MSHSRNSRREFLRNIGYLTCGGSAAALIPQLRMMGTALASTSAVSGYKALICLYFSGGNDSWNLVVPHDTTRFNTYSNSRNGVFSGQNPTGLALANPADGNAQIITDTTDSSKYFVHPNMPKLAGLYKQNKAAFVANVGTLVKPINKVDYTNNNDAQHRPPQLFSHADQENLWHQANTSSTTTRGWGGLCADDLQVQAANLTSSPELPLCVSISGANRFEVGNVVTPYQLSSSGLNKLNGLCNPCSGGSSNTSARDLALNALIGETYANDFAGEYANVFTNGRSLFSALYSKLSTATVGSFTTSTLGNQLKTVAQMIKISNPVNNPPASAFARRQIYYVRLGGFDMHSGLMSTNANSTSSHAGLLTQVDTAISEFWTEMGVQGLQNDVTLFTATEFARTLQSNGAGSDHAWGGMQFVLGGSVSGGKLYCNGNNNKGIDHFPDQSLTATNNFSRGQMVPGISVDQYAATMAKWMDVSSGSLTTIFPNLGNFGGTLGFLPAS